MLICGIDEAGRGPLAGPVCAAAVILPENFDTSVLNDSKKMSPKKREAARKIIFEQALFCETGWASCAEIDEINILQATLLAMCRAFEAVYEKVYRSIIYKNETINVLVDGNSLPELTGANSCKAVIKGDSIYPEIMAASITAKTVRDKMMNRYSWLYPEYGYEKHKGYGTAAHLQAIRKYGTSPIQRKSFSVKMLPAVKLN